LAQEVSAVLPKRKHRLEDVPHAGITGALVAPSLTILMLLAILVVLGHFFPAR
jgi:hypothetical protein